MAAVGVLLLAASLARAADAPPNAIRVVTFNAAGIPLVHPGIGRRTEEAGKALAALGADIVGLQETWRNADAATIEKGSGLPYKARVPRLYAFRTGLTILSRWPILSVEETAFSSVRPSLRHITEGEFMASKGFLRAVVATPWGELDVYAAHTLADYSEAQYHLLRLTELFELAETIREKSKGRPFVILGDLNSGRGDREYDAFVDLLGLSDACEKDGKDQCPDPDHSPRIDHILLAAPVARGRKVLDASIAGTELRLSDHPGFAADLPRAVMALRARPDPSRRAVALRQVADEVTATIARLEAHKEKTRWIPLYGAFLSARYDRQAARLSVIRERAASAIGNR